MTKKERIRLLTGVAVMALLFGAVASIGWTQDEFLITYYYGYDGKYEMHTVKKGYQKDPLEPGRYGYLFDGWYYTDKQGNELPFDFESERVVTDIELTAHWRPYETEVHFNPNGGECEVESLTAAYGVEFTMPKAERDGYYFVGWTASTLISPETFIWRTIPEGDVRIGFRACWSKFEPGTSYFIGEYEQNSMSYDDKEKVEWSKEPIEWIPVDKKDGKYLLISKYTLDVGCLGRSDGRPGYVPWADCELRKWLNGEFYEEVFSEAEKDMICDFRDDSLGTTDRVSLPSIEEARLLYDMDTYGIGTLYALENGLDEVTGWCEFKVDGEYKRYYEFHTRSFKGGKNWAMTSALHSTGARVKAGIRPAIWVDANKLLNK